MATQRRRWPWLLGAAVLIGLAALLMRVGEDDVKPRPTWDRVDIPRRASQEDKTRMALRQTLAPSLPPPVDAGEAPRPARPRDPVLAALGGDFKKGAFVLEANAVRNSPIGQLLVDCLTSADDGERLRRIRERTGLDPLTDLDRIAVSDDMVVLSGNFKGLKPEALGDRPPTQFGDQGQLYELFSRDGGAAGNLGTWGDQMLVFADDAESLKQTFERIEGKRAMENGALNDLNAYGEIYGVLSPEALGEMIEDENPGLGKRVGEVAQRVVVHVDTSGDVGVAAHVEANNPNDAKEVSKALGAAMSLARLKAQADGKTEIADLLDMSKVTTDGSGFRLEAGVPQQWIEQALKRCVERNRARRAQKTEEPAQVK